MNSPPALEMETRRKSFSDKPRKFSQRIYYGAELKSHQFAETSSSWQSQDGRLTMAAAKETRLYTFPWMKSPTLMVRRTGVRKTDFVALVSKQVKSVEQIPVMKGDGTPADAVGVKVTLANGKTFHAIVNYEPAGIEVNLGGLKTNDRFATDYEEKP